MALKVDDDPWEFAVVYGRFLPVESLKINHSYDVNKHNSPLHTGSGASVQNQKTEIILTTTREPMVSHAAGTFDIYLVSMEKKQCIEDVIVLGPFDRWTEIVGDDVKEYYELTLLWP